MTIPLTLATAGVRRACRPLLAAALTAGAAAMPSLADEPSPTTVRGVVRAESAATIASEIVARVATLPFKTGQAFRAGDILLSFDCRRYEADLRAAEAEVRTQEITLNTQRHLLQHKATGALDVALAEAKHGQATAAADSLRVRTSQCVIRAPYDGRVVERAVDVFEMPQANAPLLKIVKDGALEIELVVPSSWSVWMRPGFTFSFRIDETASEHEARLLHTGALVDPVSRTMKVTAVLVAPAPSVRPGMSGTARVRAPERISQ